MNEDKVRKMAYYIWQEEGCPAGRDQEHWMKAMQMCACPTRSKKTACATTKTAAKKTACSTVKKTVAAKTTVAKKTVAKKTTAKKK